MKKIRFKSLLYKIKQRGYRFEWLIIISLGFLAIILGYIGLYFHLSSTHEDHSFSGILYRTVQLFFIDSGFLDGIEPPLNWELNIARFLAPFTIMYTAFKALTILFSDQLKTFRFMFIKDHIVICGLGAKGQLIARQFLEKGNRVVVIEQDVENDFIRQIRKDGAYIVMGNASDAEILKNVGVCRARHIICVCGGDGINTEIAVHARELSKSRSSGVLTCYAHIVDPQLCSLLRKYEIESTDTEAYRLDFFNIYESGVQSLLKEHPAGNDILIVGFGKLGRSLLIKLARDRKNQAKKENYKLNISVIDKNAKEQIDNLCTIYPQINNICQIKPLEIDINSTEFMKASYLFNDNAACNFSNLYICLDDDSFGLSAALKLHHHLLKCRVPIIVRMNHDFGLANLLHGNKTGEYENLYAFGLLGRTCKIDTLLGGTHEIIAQAIHRDYVENELQKNNTIDVNPSMAPWEELPASLKESNYRQADHIGIKLKLVNCGVEILTDWDAELFEFSPEEIELLSKEEHNRWCIERRQNNWKYGVVKDIALKTNPCLVDWLELPEVERQKDRNAVKGLPLFLAKAGLQIYRK